MMSGTFLSIRKTASRVLHYALLEIHRIEKKHMSQNSFIHSTVLDVMRKKACLLRSDYAAEEIGDLIDRDLLSGRIIKDYAGTGKTARPYQPADSCISACLLNLYF